MINFSILNKLDLKPLLFQSLGRLSSQGLGFILGVIIVNVLGLEIMGQYAKYTALINISFGVFATGIFTNYLRSNDYNLLGETIYSTSIVMIIFLLIFGPIYVLFFDDSFLNITLILISVYFMKLSEVIVITNRFLNIDKNAVLPRVIPYVIIIILCLLIKPNNIYKLLLIISIGWFSVVYFFFKIKKIIVLKNHSFKKIISSSVLLSITVFSTQVYANFDQLMIMELLDAEKLGIYKIGLSFSVLAMPLVGVFSFIYISKIKEYLKGETIDLLRKKFYNQIKINFVASFLFFLFCLFFIENIIVFVYNISDPSASNVVIILSLGIVFNVVSVVYSYSLLAINKDKTVLVITLIGGLFNVILNCIAIPRFGIIGAAVTSLLTQMLILFIYSYIFSFRLRFFEVLQNQ